MSGKFGILLLKSHLDFDCVVYLLNCKHFESTGNNERMQDCPWLLLWLHSCTLNTCSSNPTPPPFPLIYGNSYWFHNELSFGAVFGSYIALFLFCWRLLGWPGIAVLWKKNMYSDCLYQCFLVSKLWILAMQNVIYSFTLKRCVWIQVDT